MFDIFRKEQKEIPVIVSDFKRDIISESKRNYKIHMKDLFDITEDCKALMGYAAMSDSDKYKLEKYQDMILLYAENLKLGE